jgi:hypothetical protein
MLVDESVRGRAVRPTDRSVAQLSVVVQSVAGRSRVQ